MTCQRSGTGKCRNGDLNPGFKALDPEETSLFLDSDVILFISGNFSLLKLIVEVQKK